MHGSSTTCEMSCTGAAGSSPGTRETDVADLVKTNRNIVLIAAGVLALGVVIGGYLLGDGLRRARMADRAVTMRGLAERNVTADLATWNVNFGVQGTDITAVQAEVDRDAAKVHEFFRREGFADAVLTD